MEIGIAAALAAARTAKEALTTYQKGSLTDELENVLRASIELLERANAEARDEITELNRKLDRAQTAHQRAEKDLEVLKEKHRLEVRFRDGFLLKRGEDTGGKWVAFCPKCGVPAVATSGGPFPGTDCPVEGCGWRISKLLWTTTASEIEREGT